MARRDDSPGIGHGLAIVGAVAEALDIAPGRNGQGTAVTMTFAAGQVPESAPGLQPLCRLALDTVADVSCVDLVRGGVLHRVVGEVAGDAGLTNWLRNAIPPRSPAPQPGRRCARAVRISSSTIRPCPAPRVAPARSSAWSGESPSRSRGQTARRRPCGASADGPAGALLRPLRPLKRWATPLVAISPTRRSVQRCASASAHRTERAVRRGRPRLLCEPRRHRPAPDQVRDGEEHRAGRPARRAQDALPRVLDGAIGDVPLLAFIMPRQRKSAHVPVRRRGLSVAGPLLFGIGSRRRTDERSAELLPAH